ncbi:MAG: hypothetical protein DDT21_02313 [Syntrophomonadaceae bacterium]|nr:hypothetical protein [Bacillota bacterium]
MSGIHDFEMVMQMAAQQTETLLPLVDQANDLFIANRLQTLVDATGAQGKVGDSNLTKESVAVYVALLAAFIQFAGTPLPGIGLTPKQIVRLRG